MPSQLIANGFRGKAGESMSEEGSDYGSYGKECQKESSFSLTFRTMLDASANLNNCK